MQSYLDLNRPVFAGDYYSLVTRPREVCPDWRNSLLHALPAGYIQSAPAGGVCLMGRRALPAPLTL